MPELYSTFIINIILLLVRRTPTFLRFKDESDFLFRYLKSAMQILDAFYAVYDICDLHLIYF